MVRIGTNKLILILAVCAIVILVSLRKNWKEQFELGEKAGTVIVVLLVTLLSRLILAYKFPYLAGDDSLHHSLITNLVATTGNYHTIYYHLIQLISTTIILDYMH